MWAHRAVTNLSTLVQKCKKITVCRQWLDVMSKSLSQPTQQVQSYDHEVFVWSFVSIWIWTVSLQFNNQHIQDKIFDTISYINYNYITLNKISPCRADGRLLCSGLASLRDQWNSKSRDTKTRPNIKNLARSNLDLSLIHIWRCRRIERCRSRWSPYH